MKSRLSGCSGTPSSFEAGVTKGGILEQLAQCPRQGPLASSKPEARIPCKGRADPRNLSLARDRSPQEEYHSWFRRKSGVGTGEWQVFVTRSCSEPLELLGERQLLIAGIFRLVFAQHMNQLDASRITRGMSH